jgi:hypothetical protein
MKILLMTLPTFKLPMLTISQVNTLHSIDTWQNGQIDLYEIHDHYT